MSTKCSYGYTNTIAQTNKQAIVDELS